MKQATGLKFKNTTGPVVHDQSFFLWEMSSHFLAHTPEYINLQDVVFMSVLIKTKSKNLFFLFYVTFLVVNVTQILFVLLNLLLVLSCNIVLLLCKDHVSRAVLVVFLQQSTFTAYCLEQTGFELGIGSFRFFLMIF